MKTLNLIVILILQSFLSVAQDSEGLWKKYSERKYDYILEETKKLSPGSENSDTKLLLGRVYIDIGETDQGITYLKATLEDNQQPNWRIAWANAYLGVAYFQKGMANLSKKHLQDALNLNATEAVTKFTKNRMALFGFSNVYDSFIVRESEHIVFHFDPLLEHQGKIEDQFIKIREESYKNIGKFFECKTPKKIHFFVWSSVERLNQYTGGKGGFSIPEFCITQTVYGQTPGHELTHIISNYHAKILHKSALVNEGIAVFLDQTNKNRLALAKQIVKEAGLTNVNLPTIWENKLGNERAYYAIAAAWVEFLIEKEGREKFLELFKNQTIENARLIYSTNIDSLLLSFHSNFLPHRASKAVDPCFFNLKISEVNAVLETQDPTHKYFRVLLLIDGKPMSTEVLEKIHPGNIASFRVIKEPMELKKFTIPNLHGIILLTTK